MAGIASTIPNEIFYQFASKNQSIDELIRTIYTNPSPATVTHFKSINSHFKNAQVIAGQMVVITPSGSLQCTSFESDLAQAARLVDKKMADLSAQEKKIMAKHYQLLNNIASYGGAGYGATLTYFSHHMNNVKDILKQISELYVKTYNSKGDLYSKQFFQQRKQLFTRLDNTLKTFVGHSRMGYTTDFLKTKTNLGLSSKSIMHQWKTQTGPVVDVPGFEKNYVKTARLATVLKGAGQVGIALDVGQSVLKIREACTVGTDKQCTKSYFKQGGRLTGSIAGGTGGGFVAATAAYATCILLFGLETVGTSLLWCGIVGGVAGGYLGGKYVGQATEAYGETLYETTLGK